MYHSDMVYPYMIFIQNPVVAWIFPSYPVLVHDGNDSSCTAVKRCILILDSTLISHDYLIMPYYALFLYEYLSPCVIEEESVFQWRIYLTAHTVFVVGIPFEVVISEDM